MSSMKIIISPAKKMRSEVDVPVPTALPVFLTRTELLLKKLRSMSSTELKALWQCNDAITDQNIERLSHMELRRNVR